MGQREFIASTGTHLLAVAKLVACATLARWRQQLMELERLALGNPRMTPELIIKLTDGHPLLAIGNCLPLTQAAAVTGLAVEDLLRGAEDSRIRLYARFAECPGFLVLLDELEVDDPQLGSKVIPKANQMPESAIRYVANGTLAVPDNSQLAVAACLLAKESADVVFFMAPDGDAKRGFAPEPTVWLTVDNVEVNSHEVDAYRRSLAATIAVERVVEARELVKAKGIANSGTRPQGSDRLFSAALQAYAGKFLPQKITSQKEIERVRSGIALFVEFEGDLPLSAIDSERLRSYRDEKLSKVPARENAVRTKFKTTSITESIAAVSGSDWPVMSPAERELRMQWIARMFKWLKDQKWITDDPMTGLRGESVESKADRRNTALKKAVRKPFSNADLTLIFNAPWFQTGRGELTAEGTYREFCPFRYWLPILGVFSGGRINELCQLYVDDVAQTEAGTWYLDINKNSADKSLKEQKDSARCWSIRKVPLHPVLIDLGFIEWCQRLRAEGFRRVFPELSWNETTHYAKEPIRAMSQFLLKLGMPRDNTKVFHSFRHVVNNEIMKVNCPPEVRKRLLGHEPGAGVNERHYLADPTPDETISIIRQLDFGLPPIAAFDIEEGVMAVKDALRRKNRNRGAFESHGANTTP